jgi:hypothetical protein
VEGFGEDLGVLSKIVCVKLQLGVEGFCMTKPWTTGEVHIRLNPCALVFFSPFHACFLF